MSTRRAFLRTASAGSLAALAAFHDDGLQRVADAATAVAGRAPEEVARDEDFWREVQQAFTLDRTLSNLNNGGVCPSPRVVLEAQKRYLEIANQAPVHYMWRVLEPGIEAVRTQLAELLGCDREEVAITRNASESLQICQLGLDLKPGDEVVTTTHDYPRMLDTWEQRVRREGIVLRRVPFEVPPSQADLVSLVERALTPRTKVVHICHVTNLTGHVFPVRELCDLARARGILTIVDGAHAFAHLPFRIADLGCDYYGVSLHKWLLAPVGTGLLWMRRALIERTWPLQPAGVQLTADIRKFEEIGTHPAATHNAIAEAIVFHRAIGTERKLARLRYLRDRWAHRLQSLPNVRMNTDLSPAVSCGLANLRLSHLDSVALAGHLWDRHRIIVVPIKHAPPAKVWRAPEQRDTDFRWEGIRVTPNVYTTLDEIDRFAGAVERAAREGIA
jgi:selenocysteine lyase/cysteine desulfurase